VESYAHVRCVSSPCTVAEGLLNGRQLPHGTMEDGAGYNDDCENASLPFEVVGVESALACSAQQG
jgi:hypothetical protein